MFRICQSTYYFFLISLYENVRPLAPSLQASIPSASIPQPRYHMYMEQTSRQLPGPYTITIPSLGLGTVLMASVLFTQDLSKRLAHP